MDDKQIFAIISMEMNERSKEGRLKILDMLHRAYCINCGGYIEPKDIVE